MNEHDYDYDYDMTRLC